MKYSIQTKSDHYNDNYEDISRFVSYFYQKEAIIKKASEIDSASILEIGIGSGFLSTYLKSCNYSVKTFDFDKDLEPDYVGDITEISSIVKDKFDIVCCFEVLEHIKFRDVSMALSELSKITKKYLIISVPQQRLYFSFCFKLPMIKIKQFMISLPFPLKHKFDGQHYWELGKKNYPREKFRSLLTRDFKIEREFTSPLNPYHRLFILKK